MSQMPPSGYQQPPYGQPPYGQPPYGQPYPYPPYPQQRRLSAAAVISLICGVLLCVPLLSSLLAVIFGLVGLVRTGGGQMRGRGLAATGLLLGILGLIAWPVGGYWLYQQARPVLDVTDDFLRNAADGKVDDAFADCADTMTRKDVEQFSNSMKEKGAYRNISISGANVEKFGARDARWWNVAAAS